MIYGFFNNLAIAIDSRKWIDLKRIWPLIVAALFGTPLGIYALVILEADVLKVFIGTVIVPFAIALLIGYQARIQRERLAFIPIGFFSGFLSGSTTLSGPPVTLFLINQAVEKQIFRANLATYFLILATVTIPSYNFVGLITGEVITYLLLFALPVIIGLAAGIKLSRRVNERLFRRIALALTIVSGAISIVSGLGWL